MKLFQLTNFRWICVDDAFDLSIFVLCNTIYTRLLRSTCWSICWIGNLIFFPPLFSLSKCECYENGWKKVTYTLIYMHTEIPLVTNYQINWIRERHIQKRINILDGRGDNGEVKRTLWCVGEEKYMDFKWYWICSIVM